VYYLRVFESNDSISPNYNLTIDGPDGNVGDRFEANDSFASAADLGQLGDRVEHDLSIHAVGNDDYYRFTAFATGALDVSLNFVHALGDLDMELFDQFGSIAVSNSVTDLEQFDAPVVAGNTYCGSMATRERRTNYSLTFDGPAVRRRSLRATTTRRRRRISACSATAPRTTCRFIC
jgi:hypothetical protein